MSGGGPDPLPGARRARPAGPARSRSLRRSFATLVLTGEVLVVGFAALVAKELADVPGRVVLVAALALAALCVLAAGTLRSRAGYLLGWLVQLLLLASAFWVPMMGLVGAIFAALWLAALISGGRADDLTRRRAAAAARTGPPAGADEPR